MLITIALVVLVIFCFVRNAWATVIPVSAIPLSLVGDIRGDVPARLQPGQHISVGLTIAVGFVVDDAIVVIENIMRHLEMDKGRLQAAIEGTREVGFTVVSMTVSLMAVFIPVLLMTVSLDGLFREFAVTVAVVIVMSGHRLPHDHTEPMRMVRPSRANPRARQVIPLVGGDLRCVADFYARRSIGSCVTRWTLSRTLATLLRRSASTW